jgi:hypothetical protein
MVVVQHEISYQNRREKKRERVCVWAEWSWWCISSEFVLPILWKGGQGNIPRMFHLSFSFSLLQYCLLYAFFLYFNWVAFDLVTTRDLICSTSCFFTFSGMKSSVVDQISVSTILE